ncbi:unnamed protein product [Camellia sinensis]
MVIGMSEFNLNEAFWEELGTINLEDILAEHYTPASAPPEGWRDSEDIVRRLYSGLAKLMGRPIYVHADPNDVAYLSWKQSRAYVRKRYLGPARILGLASRYDRPHYIIGPLLPDFAERMRNVYLEDYIFTNISNPLEIINIQNVDFNNVLSYIEIPRWIADQAF